MMEYNTGLSGTVNEEILNSVLGQLSDGKWENTPSMDKYWKGVSIEEKNGPLYVIYPRFSGYARLQPAEIGEFFANRIKTLVKEDVGKWDRKDETVLDYLGSDKVQVTVRDAYRAYDALKGRKNRSDTNEA